MIVVVSCYHGNDDAIVFFRGGDERRDKRRMRWSIKQERNKKVMGSHGNGANQLSHGDLLISRELIESTLELIADRLVFLLLLDQVGFKFITFLLEFSGLSLALSGASLSVLESGAEIANGLLVRLFAGKGLSLGNFEGLHVVANDLQLFFQFLDLSFSIIGALLSTFKIHLQHRQASRGLVVFSVKILSDHLRFLE